MKTQIIVFGYHFYYVIAIVSIYSIKNIGKILIHFGDALCKKYYFFIARGVQTWQ